MDFRIANRKPVNEFLEAKSLGLMTRPVLLVPGLVCVARQGPQSPPGSRSHC